MINNLTVLVGTCDSYSPIWENFIKCYEKYFPYSINTLFVGETKNIKNYNSYTPGKLPWGYRIKSSLELIQDDYILFILDDYFMSFDYGKERLNKYIEDMNKFSMNRLQISKSGSQIYLSYDDYYLKFHNSSPYSFSLQPSIWKKEWIYNNCYDHYTPWDFEIINSQKYYNQDISTYVDPSIWNSDIYFNAVRKGFIKSPGWEKFKNKENLQDF